MTKEQVITRIKHNQMYKDDRETADYIIKALEQQPCEDCVSRKQLLEKTVKKNGIWNKITNSKGENLEEIITKLPTVTPTHGICKDCSHYDPLTCNSGTCLNPNMQWSNEVSATHYCADFEKRGDKA